MGKRALGVVFIVALLVTAGASPAGAVTEVPTKIVSVQALGFGDPATWTSVFGGLKTKAKCKEGRTITVTHAPEKAGPHTVYGTDVSDADGFWSANGTSYEDYHFVIKVAKRKVGNTKCLAGRISGFI